jgi:ABC-type transport system substrate-binding protein
MIKTIKNLGKIEKIAIVFLGLIVIFTGFQIWRSFYLEYSDITPINGGVFTEGVVGKIGALNPLFAQQGTITQDLTQLIFSGLTKYDSNTRDIVPDLANYKIASNGKEYTFVLKENVKWHNGDPVTADDIIFTYNSVIKNPEFNGAILNYSDYSGIKVTKLDDRTVQFLLEKPDSFFLVKTMTGILPKKLLENEPIAYLESSPFNFMPIGSGRYKFVAQTVFPDHTEISLEAFKDFYDGPPNIENFIMKIYENNDELIKNLGELDGIRSVPEEDSDKILSKGFTILHYQLPQYVAVFINNESPKLKGSKVRLALQLGTDKESLIKEIGQDKIIDTPLLEIDQENWFNQYSVSKANGALFDTQWKIPEQQPVEVQAEESPATDGTEKTDENTETKNTTDKPDGQNTEEASKNEEIKPAEETGDKTEEALSKTTDETSETAVTAQPAEPDTNEVTFINSPNEGKDWETTTDRVTITGTVPKDTKMIIVNDYELKKFVPGDKGWSYVASAGFDNLKPGENIYKVYAVDFKDEKKLIDSIKITYGTKVEFTEKEKGKLAEENSSAPDLPIRVNKDGEALVLDLITSKKPEVYGQVAEILKKQWKKIGVDVNIEILDSDEFQSRLNKREYDLLIFGQNLGYNLDAYPYWHSSQAKEGGLNLSQFKNFVVDSLLEKARYETDEDARKTTLSDIQYIISQEAPAIFLYSPTYYLAMSNNVQNASFENLATVSDRFASIESWYAKVDRRFKKGTNPLTFIFWITKQF